jgi:hypothetical protein
MSSIMVPGTAPTALSQLYDVSITSVANGEVLTFDSSVNKWVNNPIAGLVTSVSNSDGTLTISPTTGAVIASLNLSHANTWLATQTFGNNISFGGAPLNVTSLASGNILQYNGADWVNVTPASIAIVSSVSNTDGTLTISPTAGSVVASINLANTNIWTANQVIGSVPSASPPLALTIGGTETTVSVSGGTYNTKFQTHQEGSEVVVDIGLGRHSDSAGVSGNLYILCSRGVETAKVAVQNGDDIGTFYFFGYDGSTYQQSFYIDTVVDGAVSAGVVPVTVNFGVMDSVGGINNLLVLDGAAKAVGLARIETYKGITTSGLGVAVNTSNASETELATTGATPIVSYAVPVLGAGNYSLLVYFRVTTASTVVTITASWTDQTGAQTYTWVSAVSEPVGSYTCLPIFINSAASNTITVTATAGTANQVYVSAAIMGM